MYITDHAKEALEDRYGILEKMDINTILNQFFRKPNFKTIQINKDGSCVRQTKFKGEILQGIINLSKKTIITILPDMIEWSETYEHYDKLHEKIRELKEHIKQLTQKVENRRPNARVLFKFGKYFIGRYR